MFFSKTLFVLSRRKALHVHLLLSYTKAKLLHLVCLKTPTPNGGLIMIGSWLSRERILTFASLTESSMQLNLHPLYQGAPCFICRYNNLPAALLDELYSDADPWKEEDQDQEENESKRRQRTS